MRRGIFIPSDDKLVQGIRPRWAKIYAVGPDQTELKVNQWILIAHGRWTRGIKINDGINDLTVRRVDENDILLSSDEVPLDETLGTPL